MLCCLSQCTISVTDRFGWLNTSVSGRLRPQARRGHSCVSWTDQCMVLFGGYRSPGYLNDLWLLDISTLEWSCQSPAETEEIPDRMSQHSAAVLGDIMWLFGGHLGNRICVNELWAYDLRRNAWNYWPPPDSSAAGSGVRGKSAWPSPRYEHAAVSLQDTTKMLVFGGMDTQGHHCGDSWLFDATTLSWQLLQPLVSPPARHGHSLTRIGSQVLLFGGFGAQGRLNDLWAFQDNQWKPVIPEGHVIPSRRAYHAAASFMGSLVVFGGQAGDPAVSMQKTGIAAPAF